MINPKIIIRRTGRIANQMFQLMIAYELKKRVPLAEIYGASLVEWNLQFDDTKVTPSVLVLKRHKFDLDHAAYLLRTRLVGSVVIDGWGMRLSYFPDPSFYKRLFVTNVQPRRIHDNQILLNIRSEDIENGHHQRYYPLPFSFYECLIDTTGLQPVFMGQLDNTDYVLALKRKFNGAIFLPKASVMEDFQTIRNAANLAISVSSFAWLAAWLSERAHFIHFPVAGLYDPQNGETLLMPVDDERYRFYDIQFPNLDERKSISASVWAGQVKKLN